MSGSFKKIAKANQKVHRERAQPASRAHLGSLEKKKDYVERAREHHKKRDKIKALRKKAADRNPDEFYFNMVASEKVEGVHQAKSKDKDEDQELLLQRKDLRYVQMKVQMEKKKIEKLQGQLHLLDPNFRVNRHTVFVEDDKEIPKAQEKLRQIKAMDQLKMNSITPEQQQALDKKYGELAKRNKRLKDLSTVEAKLQVSMDLKKDKTAKKKLVKEETKDSAAVYRWCFQRKR